MYVLHGSSSDGKLVNNRSREADHDDADTTTIYILYINTRALSLPSVYYCFSVFNNKIIISERLWSSASHTTHWVQCESLYHFIQQKLFIFFVLQSSFFFFGTSKWNVYFVFHFFFFSVFRSGNRPFVKWTFFFFFLLSNVRKNRNSIWWKQKKI